jgi:TonB family protein
MPKIRLTTDDNGIVRVMDVVPKGKVAFTVPSEDPQTRVPLALGELTLDAADKSALAKLQESSGNAAFPDTSAPARFRSYRIAPDTALVLLFGAADNTLDEAFYGSRTALARNGLLPAGAVASEPRYIAPAVVHLGAYDYPASKHQGDAFVRIDVRKDGTVSNASIYVSSGSSDLDAIAVLAAKTDTFTPAKRGDEPVDSVFFHKEEFRTLQPAR